MKIVVLDGALASTDLHSWKELEKLGELKVYDRTTASQTIERSKEADIVITNKVVFDKNVLSQLKHLKYIGVLATGYNVVDIEEASLHGILVTNIPAYSTMSVAQMVFAHILNVTNHVGHYVRSIREGKWCRATDFAYWDTPLVELAGKKIGIYGLGNIGKVVANIASSFGMDVSAVTAKGSAELPESIRKVTFQGMLATCDFITLHCPLTESTREIINKQSLGLMRQGTVLINTGRGALVNEQDVADALNEGQLGAYCADVLNTEPPAISNPLLTAPNAFITPHIAWATKESRERLIARAVDNVKSFIEGHPMNVVNM